MLNIHTLRMSTTFIPAGETRRINRKVVPEQGHVMQDARVRNLSGSSFLNPNHGAMTAIKIHTGVAYTMKISNVALTDPNFSSRQNLGTMMPHRLMQLSFVASNSAIRPAASCKRGLFGKGAFHFESFNAKNMWLPWIG